MDRIGVIPHLKENAPTIAHGDLCFLHGNYTMNGDTRINTTVSRDGGAIMLFSFMLGGIMGLALMGTFQSRFKRYNDVINAR